MRNWERDFCYYRLANTIEKKVPMKLSVTRHKGDGNDNNDDDDVSNHLKCKHTFIYT